MMRSRRDIFETKKNQWNKHLELLSLKITELTVELATREALMDQVKLIHKDILVCDQASPHLYKKINDALEKLEGEIILLSLPLQTTEKRDALDRNTSGSTKKISAGSWSFFYCCSGSSSLGDATFDPPSHSRQREGTGNLPKPSF